MWDIKGQYSIDSVLGFSGPVTNIATADKFLVASSEDEVLKILELKVNQIQEGNATIWKFFVEKGEFKKFSKERTLCMKYEKSKRLLLILSVDGILEIWRRSTKKEIAKRLIRIKKRKLENMKNRDTVDEQAKEELKAQLLEYKNKAQELVKQGEFDPKYMFTAITSQQFGNKARNFAYFKKEMTSTPEYRLIIGMNTNTLELWNIQVTKKKVDELTIKEKSAESNIQVALEKIQSIGWWGHQTPIRVCANSNNDQLLLTASTECIKIWNINSLLCTKTSNIENVVSAVFLPGDKYVILGTKEGFLFILDCSSLEILQKIEGHNGEVWSLNYHPNPDIQESDLCIISGAADKSVKLWTLAVKKENNLRILQLILLKKIETTDDVLCSLLSPNGKLIAFSLLDSTIKVINFLE